MRSKFEIRGAERNELDRVAELAQAAAPLLPVPNRDEVKRLAGTPNHDWHVAVDNRFGVVAVAHTEMLTVGKRGRDLLSLNLVSVDLRQRQQGLGSAMLSRCIEFAQERHVSKIHVPAPMEIGNMGRFFLQAGFSAMPKYYELKLDENGAVDHGAELKANIPNKGDGRLPTSLEKKRRFLKNAYPDQDFSDDEIESIFSQLPAVVESYQTYFNPRTRNRLNWYIDSLMLYSNTDEATSQILPRTPFKTPNALHVWQKGFARAMAQVVGAEDLRILASSLAEQASAANS